MMTFSGPGSYRAGGSGSFSSSSLSPLALPFKVDKTVTKLNLVNPTVSYPDVPMYGPYFDPTGHFWNPSSSAASGQNLVSTESMGINTSCSSSLGIYGFPGSQSSTSATGAYHVNSGAVDAYDPFTYDPFPNRMSSTAEEGGKPYYSPYVPSAPQKDGYLSLGVGSGHGFDLLSNTSSVHLGGGGSSQVDRPQVRDGDCKVNWGSFWGGVNENEQAKWSGYGQGFSSKDSSIPNLSSNEIPFPFDGSNKSQSCNDVNTHPFTDGTCNIHFPSDVGNKSTLKQDSCFDIFGGTYHLGSFATNRQDTISVLDWSTKPTSESVSVSGESSRIQEPVLESVTDVCGSQKANASSPGDHFSQSGFYVFGCSSTTSTNPATMTKPYLDSSSFAESTLSALKLIPRSSVASDKSSGSVGYDSSCQIDPQMSVGLKQQPSVVIRRPVSSVIPSSSKIDEMVDSQFKGKNSSEKIQNAPHKTHQFSSEVFNLEFNEAQAEFSAEKKTDVHNPAEDSPCWRGASKHFSPFEVAEGNSPDALDCKSLCPQEPMFKSLLVDTRDSRDSIVKKGIQPNDDEEKSSATRNPLRFDLNAVGGLQFGNDTCLSTKGCCTSNKSKPVSYPGVTLDTHPLELPVQNSCSGARSESTPSEGSENCHPVATESSSGSPSGIDSKCANSTAEDNASVKHCQSSKVTDANIDVNVLLKTMTKLSEIFRCYSFVKRDGVSDQHIIAIKHIIANLNASLLMMVGEATPTMVSPQGTSSNKELPISLMDAEAITDAVTVAGMAEGLLDSVSLKDDTVPDADKTGASKKILLVNLQEEEEAEAEADQQKLLYKTLWLEAEASLCAMTAKARLIRVKAELGKAPGGAKDVQGAVGLATLDKVLSVPIENKKPNAGSQINHSNTPDPYKEHTPIHITEDTNSMKFEGLEANKQDIGFPPLHATGPGITGNVLDGSGTTSHAFDVEASVMSRYQILKNRVENSEGLSCECEQPSVGEDYSSSLCPPGCDSLGTEISCELNRAEIPVLARYQILKSRVNHDSRNDERCQTPGEDNYLPDRDSLSPRYQILDSGVDNSDPLYEGGDSSTPDEPSQNSQVLANSVGAPDEGEASVMARFRIIQSCINQSNSVNRDQTFGHADKEAVSNVLRCSFGPYPDLSEDKDADQFGFCVDTGPFLAQHCKTNRLTTEIFESWYDNDCSTSDWEHVSGDDLRRQN